MADQRRNQKIKRLNCASYIREALRYLKPPERLTVSQWAEKYRLLTNASAIPGPWRNRKTPYLIGVMNEMLNYETEEIIFCKCTQVGGTEALMNMIGYVIQQDPSPTLIVYPTDKLADSISTNKLVPMIKASPSLSALYKEFQSQKTELQFTGMTLYLEGSNSPSSLASRSIKYLMLDEVDKYPASTKKEADPINLARERTKTFMSRKRIFMTSTPTVREGHIWNALENADIEKHYFVPCPHCGEMIELKFEQIKWPDKDGMSNTEKADLASYVCQECGSVIQEYQKDRMLQEGEWRIVKHNTTYTKKVAFWINTLYSPFVRFSEIALEFLNSKDDPEKLQNFKNSWLAEPWEDMATHTDADMVLERQTEDEEYMVPEWAKMLTGGVDVQQNCLYYTVRAWGDYLTSQCITHGQVSSFADIERVMNLTYRNAKQDSFVVQLCLVDSGYNADETYEFCINNSEWAMPVKGSNTQMGTHYKISTVNKPGRFGDGIQLILTDGDKYKDMIASRMHKPNGRGSWMVYKGCDIDYARMVTAEHKVNIRSNGRVVQKWVPKSTHAANHMLDCEVYALAAADVCGVRELHLSGEPEQPLEHHTQTPEEAWITVNDDWM